MILRHSVSFLDRPSIYYFPFNSLLPKHGCQLFPSEKIRVFRLRPGLQPIITTDDLWSLDQTFKARVDRRLAETTRPIQAFAAAVVRGPCVLNVLRSEIKTSAIKRPLFRFPNNVSRTVFSAWTVYWRFKRVPIISFDEDSNFSQFLLKILVQNSKVIYNRHLLVAYLSLFYALKLNRLSRFDICVLACFLDQKLLLEVAYCRILLKNCLLRIFRKSRTNCTKEAL